MSVGGQVRKLLRTLTRPFRVIWGVLTLPVTAIISFFRYMNQDVDDRPIVDALADSIDQPAGLLTHFGSLRKYLIVILLTLAIAVGVSFSFSRQLVDFLAGPIGGIEALVAIDVTESIGVFMRVALLAGFTLASPFLAFELWLFFSSGLRKNEKRISLVSIPLVIIFLLGGMAFAYYVIFPNAMPFLLNFMGIETIPRPSSYINFVTGLMFWIGVSFEAPLVITMLTSIGVLKPEHLKKPWRFIIVGIAIAAAAVTPTVDPVNMALVMAPLFVLYLLSIGLSHIAFIARKRKKAAAE
jgi:sec-independent protein translocase protein TatC